MATRDKAHSSNPRNDLSAYFLRSILTYNKKTGIFRWKFRSDISAQGRRKTGFVAGTISKRDGYVRIKINNVSYLGHRLAWLYVKGEWPTHEIDHKKGNRSDNRWNQLREASDAQTAMNARKWHNGKHRLKGIARQTKSGRWAARIRINRNLIHLGTYDTPKEAHAKYKRAAKLFFGAFANMG